MRYVAVYLLAVFGAQESPANEDLEKILSSMGIESDAERLTRMIVELKDKSIDDLIKEGHEMPVGGGGDKKEAKKKAK
ncbi:large ribosomal subunit protein P2-like [Drosophila virilis]|uniref:Large ribosomal subunit protein P2 n=1 Tax=Drosophila virilis TaxID=7244 RepID=B4MCB2_DROVI|nr:uncharacterized protein Dvir_GJ11145 [Drosophila virilis]EDW63195.1 uncharacterized protein Dvir_GJ11144 [Drosophila virilis]